MSKKQFNITFKSKFSTFKIAFILFIWDEINGVHNYSMTQLNNKLKIIYMALQV